MPISISGLTERARLRGSQKRKLDHACANIRELIRLHMPGDIGEREMAELHMLHMKLDLLIKNQHIIDPEYREAKTNIEGDY